MTLLEAVEAQDLKQLEAALEGSPDVNALGPERKTPLIEAAARGWLEGVQALLAAGAEPEWRDASHETAMLKAAANGHVAVARLLAPHASEDDRQLANSFLAALGTAHAPEYQYDGSALKKKAIEVAARAANFVGDEDPLARLERIERAESAQKKKR